MVRVRWLKISSIIVENCLYEYELYGKKLIVRIVYRSYGFLHNPYWCGPLSVGLYAGGATVETGPENV